jgi:DNA polymerase I-like protein with 3'-5' exonuclease and polymerase domains
MKTLCDRCEQWTLLPADGGKGKRPHALCEHCATPQRADDRYVLCPHCASFYLVEYGECPLCPHAVISAAALDGSQAYATEAQQRKSRDGHYFWQLYLDYQLQPGEPPAKEAAEKPPGNSNGHALATPSPNGTSNGNGNGHAPAVLPADSLSTNGSTDDNPKSKIQSPKSTVDLAVTESMPMALFNDDETSVYTAGTAQVKVSAGAYNEFEYELIQDPSRLAEVAEMLTQEAVLGIDTETTGLDPHSVQLLLLQVSTADKVYIVDCKRLVPLALKSILENPKILKVAQNAKFEYEMLKQQTGITLSGMFDTMLAERVLTSGISREISLKAIAQKYIQATLDKTVRENFYKLTANGDAYLADEQLHYAARDAFIMIPIQQLQVPELTKHSLLQVADLEFRCIAAVGDMELAGVKIDEVSWRKIIDQVTIERDKAAGELADMLEPTSMQATMFGIPSINLNSNVQLTEALSKLGVDLPDTMEATLVKFDHPAVKKLLEYRGHEKTLSAFGESVLSLINPHTGRIHPDFNQHGADTGRFSCTKPNIQQIPATSDFRKCFVAPEGYKLVTCDYSQCIAEDSWVSARTGWVRIQDHPDRVSKGVSDTVIVTTSRKYRLECTPDHRILTHRGWVEAGALGPEDWVALSNNSYQVHPVPLDHLWWLVGFWVGDGSSSSASTIAYFSKGEEPYSSELRDFITSTLGIEPKTWGDCFGVKGQRAFVSLVKSLFDKKNLRLPLDKISSLPSFISGLFDADGSVDKNGVSFATKFIGLAQDVQQSLLRYGVMSTITPSRGGYNFLPEGGLSYRVRISDTPSLSNFARYVNFRFSRKASILQHTLLTKSTRDQGNYLPVPVEQVRQLGLPYRQYVFNHLHGRPYTRAKLNNASVMDSAIEGWSRYHWDRVATVLPSGRSVAVFDLLDQPEQRFEASGFIVHNCELRILAELSGDEGFVNAFTSGGDLHALTAAQMFGVGLEDVSKPQRSAAKAINFGLAYGMGPGGLAPRLGVSLDEAKELIARYFKAYPGVQKWLEKAAKDAVRLSYSVTTLGRKRFYTLPDESLKRFNEDEYRRQIGAIERQGKNSPIQGSNADMTKLALIRLRSALKEWDARTVNTVHDEIVVEVRNDQAEEVKHVVEREMVRAGEMILKSVPIVAEASLADYWSK